MKSPNSKFFSFGSNKGEIIITETATGEIYDSYWVHQERVFCSVFQPNGNLIASGDKDGKLVIYDYIAKKVLKTIDAHKDALTILCFTIFFFPDQTRLRRDCDGSVKML